MGEQRSGVSMHSAKAWKRRWVLVLVCTAARLGIANAVAQEPGPDPATAHTEETTPAIPTAPVVVDGTTLFSVRGVSAYPAEKRAQDIAGRISAVAANRACLPQSFRLEEATIGTRILCDKQFIMNVTDPDASIEGAHRQMLAQAYLSRIAESVISFRTDRELKVLIRRAVLASGAMLALVLFLWAGYRVVKRTRSALERRYREKIRGVQVQTLHIAGAEHLWRLTTGALNFVWAIVALAVSYADLHYVLSLFPWTRGLANSLFAILVNPLVTIATSLLHSVPDLLFLAILAVVTWYLLKLIRLFFVGIETGAFPLSGFDAAWARPTYRLVRVAVIAFAVVAAYPYVPGSSSQAFKGVSLLIGLVFSLGSTSLIGNIISGYSMAYRRLFKQGDRVQIGTYMGDVEEVRLMSTYLRTIKNELIAVPNSVIVNSEIVNYSTLAEKEGLILHTTVGVGYEASWRQVEAMLIQAAERTPGLLREPKPFVLQKELGVFAVTYEINAYCGEPRAMNRLYTALHSNILDAFNEFGVQIMTPAYEGDPKQPKIVPRDRWYAAPASPSDGSKVARIYEEVGSARKEASGG